MAPMGQSPSRCRISEYDLAVSFQSVQRLIVGKEVSVSMCNGNTQDIPRDTVSREPRVGVLDPEIHILADEPERIVAQQCSGEQSRLRENLESVADAPHHPPPPSKSDDIFH